jgi:hypothetical protein
MELTINLTEHEDVPEEHKKMLNERLKMIDSGLTTFKSWDIIKKKYGKKRFEKNCSSK